MQTKIFSNVKEQLLRPFCFMLVNTRKTLNNQSKVFVNKSGNYVQMLQMIPSMTILCLTALNFLKAWWCGLKWKDSLIPIWATYLKTSSFPTLESQVLWSDSLKNKLTCLSTITLETRSYRLEEQLH